MPLSLADFTTFTTANPLGVVSTFDPVRGPEAALVSFALTADGSVLFNARVDSRKLANIGRDGRVALVVGCAGPVSVQVEGVAALPTGAELPEWSEEFARHFPGSRAFDPEFTVVKVRPHWLRVYDTSTRPAVVTEGAPDWA
jgi:general stress protein 26